MTAEHIEKSIADALAGKSNLTEEVLSVRGFSTPTIRHLFNNICNIKNGNYLEIGLFCGATFCSSFNEDTVSIGIENHSQDFSAGFDVVKKELEDNFKKFSNRAKDAHVFYHDCFEGELSYPFKFDIYFYDGFHSEDLQAKALPYFFDKLADKFIWIVDDFNWQLVADGTSRGLEELKDKIDIEKCWVLRGYHLQNDPIYHNGIAIYLINKK